MWKSHIASRAVPLLLLLGVMVLIVVLNRPRSEPVRVALPWLHQAQFAGMYVAETKGFYRNEGVAVHLIERDLTDSPIVDLLTDGKADIAIISPGDFFRAASNGKEIVALAAVFQTTPSVIASLEKTGIKSPEDLKGKRLGLPTVTEESKLLLHALLKDEKNLENSITFSAVGYNQVDALVKGDVDAVAFHRTNELYELENKGVAYSLIFPERFGVDMYGDIIVVSRDYLSTHKKEIGGFLRATFKGWEFAEKNPDEAVRITLEVDNLKYHDAAREEYVLKSVLKMVRPSPKQIMGQMVPMYWNYTFELFQRYGIIDDIELNNFFIDASVYKELGFPEY